MANSLTIPREPRTDLEDLRDDTIAVVLNSGHTFKYIQEQNGPVTGTLTRWLYKETRFPRLDTVRSILQICDHDLAVVPRSDRLSTTNKAIIEKLRPTTTQSLPERKRRVPKRQSELRAEGETPRKKARKSPKVERN